MGTFLSLSKPATTTGLHVSEALLLAFGLLLGVGIVGEIKLPWWHKHLLKFELLVLIGVAGELIADGGIFLFSEHLQAISDAELTFAVTKAGDAKTSADNAAQATERANTAAEQAEERAAKAESDLAKLKHPRLLTEAQQHRFISRLKPFAGTPILIICDSFDGEASGLAMELSTVLKKAGWKVTIRAPGLDKEVSEHFVNTPGVIVETFGTSMLRGYVYAEAANALLFCIRTTGLLANSSMQYLGDDPKHSVEMIIGRKI